MKITSYEKTDNGVVIFTEDGRFFIQGCGPKILRCVYTKKDRILQESALTIRRPSCPPLKVSGEAHLYFSDLLPQQT